MTTAAQALLKSLDADQQKLAVFTFADAERENWHFIPRNRPGLPLKQMTPAQRDLANALLASALSARGLATAHNIMSLEAVLAELEHNPGFRDPEKYYFSIFGTPGADPWGWRCEGHHVSINITVAAGNVVVTTPQFFGANPAEVRSGPRTGFRALASEEDRGRALVRSLTEPQRRVAIIMEQAPGEVINIPGRNDTKPQGIAWSALDAGQRDALLQLARYYVERFRPAIAEDAMRRLEDNRLDALHFAWAGGLESGEPHYYRLQSDWFVVEYRQHAKRRQPRAHGMARVRP